MGTSEPDPRDAIDAPRVGFRPLTLAARALNAGRDASEILRTMVHEGMVALQAEGGTVALRDHRDRIVPLIVVGYSAANLRGYPELTLDRALPLTTAVREAAPVWLSSRAEAAARFPALLAGPTESHAWAAIPLVVDEDAIGVLGVSFRTERRFSEAERHHVTTLAAICARALRR